MAAAEKEVRALLTVVETAVESVDVARRDEQPYLDAAHNLEMVRKDSGFGFHNPPYALELLRQSLVFLKSLDNGDAAAANPPETSDDAAGLR